MSGRSFLFLQGPPGPFFAQLAAGLRAGGHQCHRININGGDLFDWRGSADNFTGTPENWPAYFQQIVARQQITDIILFGDCREYHVAARNHATAQGIVVHVFEEGYIRPDWITLERDGVNGNSSLLSLPETYPSLAARLPAVPDHAPIPVSLRQRATGAGAYFLACLLLTPIFAGYRSHRPYPILSELRGWAMRMCMRPFAHRRSAAALRRLAHKRYFLFPLQLDSDHQIRIHSSFSGMQAALRTVLKSFAAGAPRDVVLLIKEHPLDNGLHPWRKVVAAMADEYGVADRVLFIEHGDLYSIIEAAAGVVTVNSTTGTLALASGIPVIVLGRAIYDLPGITHRQSLDLFWQAPQAPNPGLYDAFCRILVDRCLLYGGFSTAAGRAALLPETVRRLTNALAAASHRSAREKVAA